MRPEVQLVGGMANCVGPQKIGCTGMDHGDHWAPTAAEGASTAEGATVAEGATAAESASAAESATDVVVPTAETATAAVPATTELQQTPCAGATGTI
ncbi:unnamed protein product, partial [Closterium sp. NIES-54]